MKGLCWAVGDGCSVNFWKDPWIPSLTDFRPSSGAPTEALEDAFVGEFIFNNGWELSGADLWLTNNEVEAIKKIQVPLRSKPDSLLWVHTPTGEYSVKSGYQVAKKLSLSDDNSHPSSSFVIP